MLPLANKQYQGADTFDLTYTGEMLYYSCCRLLQGESFILVAYNLEIVIILAVPWSCTHSFHRTIGSILILYHHILHKCVELSLRSFLKLLVIQQLHFCISDAFPTQKLYLDWSLARSFLGKSQRLCAAVQTLVSGLVPPDWILVSE